MRLASSKLLKSRVCYLRVSKPLVKPTRLIEGVGNSEHSIKPQEEKKKTIDYGILKVISTTLNLWSGTKNHKYVIKKIMHLITLEEICIFFTTIYN